MFSKKSINKKKKEKKEKDDEIILSISSSFKVLSDFRIFANCFAPSFEIEFPLNFSRRSEVFLRYGMTRAIPSSVILFTK